MNVTPEEFAAYLDGELADEPAARVATAIATDPRLASRLEAEQRLRTTLKVALDPVLDEPVPESLTLMIAAFAADEAEQDMTDALPSVAPPAPEAETGGPSGSVLDLAAARARRDAAPPAARRLAGPGRWSGRAAGAAIAASLVLGLMVGSQWAGKEGPVVQKDGMLVAAGDLANGLETRLAATDTGGDALRITASFQRTDGDYCRAFEGKATSGIACKRDGSWRLVRTAAAEPAAAGTYRQAGSAQADLMAAAQAMASGPPLDAAQEKAAQAKGWQR